MGENAIRISDGANVKIGTNENLYYLRADQRSLVRRATHSLDVGDPSILTQLRFRFPFPDEDNVAPGDFKDFNRALGLHDVLVPVGVEHGQVQFRADRGYLILLPCPENPEGKEFEKTRGKMFGRNGWSGAVHIAMQRFHKGKLITLCQCGGCGVMHRMESLEDARPIIDELHRAAERHDWQEEQSCRHHKLEFDATKGPGLFYREVAARITRGYVEGK